MFLQIRSGARLALITVLVFAGVLAGACDRCPPNCLTPVHFWLASLEQGSYATVTEETTKVIDEGEQAEFYAEARLYRGLAQLRADKDPGSALADLRIAEELIDRLKTIDPTREQVLLYRGLMVALARLGQIDEAAGYRDQAVELAPEQQEAIFKEFEENVRRP